ncbi:hypothetical protein [Nocardioides massiliensis]|uniref:Uncharacterized protein n=1 Tax=Nocardioides massiliensis TaxID=1325935 RepID=A0ABT9NJ16_9ACTN|nr:hypothetical protein [Nocardioides massiliensis]MDP9820403.1 hypothetical protein [Nocardioides massiliensis]
MTDLLTLLREHDLPPRWDGRAVVWEGWEYAPITTLHLHMRPDVCEGCGMPTMERGFPCWSTNKGLRADSARLTHDDYRAEEEARARLPFRVKGKMPRYWWIELHAFRCHHCQLDTVWDTATDEWWVLDHTDYGDDGSVSS